MNCDVLVIGTGSISRVFCYAMAMAPNVSLRVGVLGRSRSSVDEVVRISNARAAAFSPQVSFVGDTIDWDSENDLGDKLEAYSPRLILQMASLQSPWECVNSQSAWCALIKKAGFALSIPFQAILATRVASLMKPSSIFVNACYPDAVNPLLTYLGLPVTCGIGNVDILASVLQSRFKSHQIQVVAHHYQIFKQQLGTPQAEQEGPHVWVDGQRYLNLAPVLSQIRAIKGSEVNQITGCISVKVILALLGDSPVMSHVPAPHGLPGGYPVVIQNGQVELALPAEYTKAEAIDLNRRGAYGEGAEVIDSDGFIRFSTSASHAIREYAPSLAEGFHAKDLPAVCQEYLELRDRLRGLGAADK